MREEGLGLMESRKYDDVSTTPFGVPNRSVVLVEPIKLGPTIKARNLGAVRIGKSSEILRG